MTDQGRRQAWTTSTYWSCVCCGRDPKDCPSPVLPLTGPAVEHVLHVEPSRPSLRIVATAAASDQPLADEVTVPGRTLAQDTHHHDRDTP